MHWEIRGLCFVSGQEAQEHWSSHTFLGELSFFLPCILSLWACTFVPWLSGAYFRLPPCALLWICYFLFELSWLLFSSGMWELRASTALPGCCPVLSSRSCLVPAFKSGTAPMCRIPLGCPPRKSSVLGSNWELTACFFPQHHPQSESWNSLFLFTQAYKTVCECPVGHNRIFLYQNVCLNPK